MTGCFHMVEPTIHRALQGVLQIALGCRVDVCGRQITPALLETHSTKREHWHRQFGTTEATGRD
jgi:hypothetical protein